MASRVTLSVAAFAVALGIVTAMTVRGDTSPPLSSPLRISVIGDELSTGDNAAGMRDVAWPELVADRTGWAFSVSAVAFAGYAAGNGGRLADQVATAASSNPDVVLIVGGLNDVGAPVGLVGQQASDLFGTVARALPRAQIVVVGPLWNATPAPDSVAAVSSAITTAAAGADVPMCDSVTDPWFDTSQTGPDTVRPDSDGQLSVAARLETCLRGISAVFV
ncbi:SGNH/GDSL hydrolase family protein [Actinomycetes bacterium M1A6_2h]